MEIMIASSINLEAACLYLRRKKQVTLCEASDRLDSLRKLSVLAAILHELNQGVYSKIIGAGLSLIPVVLPDGDDLDYFERIGHATLDEIGALFPISDCCYEHISEGELALHIEALSPQYCWDTWDEDFSNPEDLFDYTELYVLARLLSTGEADQSNWARFVERFGWPEKLPDLSGNLERDKFFSELDRAGLGCFKNVFRIAWYDTGNYFYDYNIYDSDGPDFIIENIRILSEEWKQAPAITKDYEDAMKMVASDHDIYKRLIDIFTACLVADPEQKGGLSLFELWTAGMLEETQENLNDFLDEEDHGHPIYDPFYGRIG